MITALIVLLSSLAAHPDSLSTSRIDIDGASAQLALRCQVLSLIEVVDGLDSDGDGDISPAEIQEHEAAILAYVADNYRLYTGTDRDFEGGRRLTAEPLRARFFADVPLEAAGFRKGAVDLELEYHSDGPILDLAIEMTLFVDTSPLHIDYASVEWKDGPTASYVLEAGNPRARIDPEGRGVWAAFVELGTRHILGGWDHLAFVVVLVLSSRRLRSLLAVVTAFTVAHSVTLALAALDVVQVAAHVQLIEAAVALSIAYVAVDNLVHPKLERGRWPEAFGFGLIHGLAFASFLGASLASEAAKGIALVSFNLGVELGQLLVVGALALLLRCLPQERADEQAFLAPTWLRRVGSVAIALVGFYWFFERV